MVVIKAFGYSKVRAEALKLKKTVRIYKNIKKADINDTSFAVTWWAVRDLNPRPDACKAPALPLRQPPKELLFNHRKILIASIFSIFF